MNLLTYRIITIVITLICITIVVLLQYYNVVNIGMTIAFSAVILIFSSGFLSMRDIGNYNNFTAVNDSGIDSSDDPM